MNGTPVSGTPISGTSISETPLTADPARARWARVIAAYGRHYVIEADPGELLVAVTRSRRHDVVTGDQVRFESPAAGQAIIESVQARRNQMRRSDARREQVIAANLDQVAILIAGEPPFSEALLLRVLIAAEREGIDCILVVTKCDIEGSCARIEPRLGVYEALGYRVLRIASQADPEGTQVKLAAHLAGRTTLLMGQSGMGKSTLVNLLVPGADLATQTISTALQTGRHTTTFTRAFALDLSQTDPSLPGGGWLLDSPGFQRFGLGHLSDSEIEHGLREFAPLLGQCRYYNCTHLHEPGCAIRQALALGRIDARRHALYAELREEAANRGS